MDFDEFAEQIFNFVGELSFSENRAGLLFNRFANPRIGFAEFCKMILPNDANSYAKLI